MEHVIMFEIKKKKQYALKFEYKFCIAFCTTAVMGVLFFS